MNFTTLFIKRPVMTTLVMIGILVFGIVAYRQLPVSDLPNVDFPTVTVSATLPGTSPQTMAATVATPLEKQFSTIAGIDNMTSTSSLGQTQIVIQFALDRNIDAAAQDVQAAIAQTARQLPQGIIPPAYQKTNPADAPILTLALTSSEVSLSALDEIGETTIAQRLSMVGGVAQVLVYGAQKYAVRLQLDPGQLATRNIALEDVAQAIHAAEREHADGRAQRPAHGADRPGDRPARERESVRRRHRRVSQRRACASRRDRADHGRRAEQQDRELVQRSRGRSCSPCSASRARTRWTSRTASRRRSRRSRRRFRRRCRCRSSTTGRQTIKASVDDVTFTLELTLVPRRRGDLPLPAQLVGDDHPEPRAADVDHRHVLGDVPAALQPGQPVADGAHARRRLRGGRRDRDAREHRPTSWRWESRRCRPRSTGRPRSALPSCR